MATHSVLNRHAAPEASVSGPWKLPFPRTIKVASLLHFFRSVTSRHYSSRSQQFRCSLVRRRSFHSAVDTWPAITFAPFHDRHRVGRDRQGRLQPLSPSARVRLSICPDVEGSYSYRSPDTLRSFLLHKKEA